MNRRIERIKSQIGLALLPVFANLGSMLIESMVAGIEFETAASKLAAAMRNSPYTD